MQSFQVVPVVKSPPTNAGDIRDVGSVPGSGGPPEDSVATHCLQGSCRDDPVDRGAWRATVHGVTVDHD